MNRLAPWSDVQSDRLAAGFMGAAIGRFHDSGPAAGSHDEAVMWKVECLRPFRQHPCERAGVLVIFRPLDRLATAGEVLVHRLAPRPEATLERRERLFGMLATVNPRRAEEDDGVLNVLRLETAQRFEILGENPQWPCFFRFEKFLVAIRERLRVHAEDYFPFFDR
jgi:hypothetical protein